MSHHESIKEFADNLHRVETLSENLPADLRATLARSFRSMTAAEKEAAREALFQDLVQGASSLGIVIGQVKKLLAITEGFQALPLNGDIVETRLREVHRRLVDAAAVLTEAGSLMFPES